MQLLRLCYNEAVVIGVMTWFQMDLGLMLKEVNSLSCPLVPRIFCACPPACSPRKPGAPPAPPTPSSNIISGNGATL